MMQAAMALLVTLWAASPEGNLLAEGGFEEETLRASAAETPRGEAGAWSYALEGTAYVRAEAGEPILYGPSGIPEVREGNNAVYVATLRGGQATLSQAIDVEPGVPYRAEVWVRTVDADGQGFGAADTDRVRLVVTEVDGQGRPLSDRTHAAGITRSSTAYEPLRVRFMTGSETDSVRVSLEANLSCNHWHGAVKLDSCSILPAESGVRVAAKSEPVRVVAAPGDEDLKAAAEWIAEFLRRRGFEAAIDQDASIDTEGGPVWILETLERDPVAQARGLSTAELATGDPERDSYMLDIASEEGRPIVHVVGRNSAGVRSGLVRLLSDVTEFQDAWYAYPGRLTVEPFFPIRRIHMGQTGRIAQGGPWADTLWTNWEDARIRDYVEQLRLCGFNSLESLECRGYRGGEDGFTDEELATQVTPKIRVAMEAARDLGMQVTQFIWGQSIFQEGQNYCWNDPEERRVMEEEYTRLAETYGDLVDHIVVHVGDPGGCTRNGCDPYRTTQEITVFLLDAYRTKNPAATATLSSWANFGFWRGYPRHEFLDESFSPREVGIALHRWYDADKARIVREANRPVDIWGWYISDFEMTLDMTLATRTIDRYFNALPRAASQEIRTLSMDQCFAGWPNAINFYLAGQKMWDPYRDLDAIRRAFCAATFGEENADAVLAVYDACESFVHPDRYYAFRPETDGGPDLFGTRELNERLEKAQRLAETVRIDPAFQPRITTPTPPDDYFAYLKRNLALVHLVSSEAEKLQARKAQGSLKPEEVEALRADVAERARPWAGDPDYGELMKRFEALITQSQ